MSYLDAIHDIPFVNENGLHPGSVTNTPDGGANISGVQTQTPSLPAPVPGLGASVDIQA